MRTKKYIEFLGFNDNQKLQHYGRCKIIIDSLGKHIIVKPINEKYKPKTTSFTGQFLRDKNILFVLAENNTESFTLVFNNEERCKYVYDAVHKHKPKDVIPKEKLYNQFLVPVFREIAKKKDASVNLFKDIVIKWTDNHKSEEKDEYMRLMKENGAYELIYSREKKDGAVNYENQESKKKEAILDAASNQIQTRKGKHCGDVNSSGKRSSQRKLKPTKPPFTKVVKAPNFKLVNSKPKLFRRLIIFTSADQFKCYEYAWSNKNSMFVCSGCRSHVKQNGAVLDYDKTGEIYVKMESKKHVCTVLSYVAKNYSQIETLKKANYEIFENPGGRRMIFIFDSMDRSLCYEYSYDTRFKKFVCKGCIPKRSLAVLCNEGTVHECIELENDEHICEKRKYEPEKYSECNDFLLMPDFEYSTKFKNGQEKKYLIIFDKNDRSLCYTYYLSVKANLFVCAECDLKNVKVNAKALKNEEGEEYVRLSNVKHVCEPRPYIPPGNQTIIKLPDFELMENTSNGIPKIFVFDLKNRKQCYVYSLPTNVKSNRFHCTACVCKNNRKREKGGAASLYLCKDESGTPYLRTTDAKHICKPQKYNPSKYESAEKCFDFFLFRLKKEPKLLKAAIYHPDDKSLCYPMIYHDKCRQTFCCSTCRNSRNTKQKYVPCKLFKNEDGKEYFEHNYKKHLCKPVKVSTIKNSGIEIIESSGLFEKKEKQLDESKIIRIPNFEISTNKAGVTDGKLFLFTSNDRNLCYEYGYNKQSKCYKCSKCKKFNLFVAAKLFTDENGEKYLTLNNKEHQCKPVKYEAEKVVTETSNFVAFDQNEIEKGTAKLIVFTSEEKDLCYEYTFCNYDKLFKCHECYLQRKLLYAKICKKEDGQEVAVLMRKDHICNPKKYVKEKYVPIKLTESEFVLHCNEDGEADKKLVVFDSNDKTMAFEYIWMCLKKFYQCINCMNQNATVFAKLIESPNGKLIELSATKHICAPQKYNPENYKPREKLYENFVLLHNSRGEPNRKLLIFNPKNKKLAYQYNFQTNPQRFVCRGCIMLNKSLTAKLGIDENGKQFIQFNKLEHCCEIRNLKERNLAFDQFKQSKDANGNSTMIVFQSAADKKSSYKFAYDGKLQTFCCVKCKESKKFITATICKNYAGTEFVLINDKHVCKPLNK